MTSPVTKITDYEQRMHDDALGQFWDSPVVQAIMNAIAIEIQRFEDVAYDFLTKRLLDNAVGDILDRIGKIARVQRLGRSDDDYRLIIQVAIAARDSDGGAEQLIWIASNLVGEDVQYVQEGTMNLSLYYDSDDTLSDDLVTELTQLMNIAVSAGVFWQLVAGESTLTGRYDDDTYGAGYYGTVVANGIGS
jgi:hypothetical protein